MGYLGDEPLFCALFAPRPVFYGSVTGDWTARFPEQGLKDIRSIYESYGALNAISHTHRDAGHNYDQLFRGAVYRFFKETLGLSGTDNETQDPDVSREVCKSLGGPKKRSPHQKTLAGEFLSRRPALIHRHQLAPALSWNPSRSPLTIPEQAPASGDFDRREFRGEGGAPITLLLKQGATKEPGPWVLAVSALPLADLPRGLSAALLQFKKLAIMTPRFSGDAGRLQKHWERNGLLLGCGVGYIAAHDIAGAAASLPGNDRVRLVTMGDEGPAGLIAATMAKRIEDVVVPTYGKSYRQDGNRRPQLPEILRLGGMEAIIGRIPPPCRLLIGGAPKDAPWRSESRRNLLTQDAALPPEAVTRALKQ